MNYTKDSHQGFTLIEFIIVIVICAIIFAMSSQLLYQGFNSYFTGTNVTSANWQAQVALERMSRTIRTIRSNNDIVTATANSFEFYDPYSNSNYIEYTLSGSNLNMIFVPVGYTETLATGVNSLTFTYYDINGNVTANLTSINYIKISLNITQNNTNFTVTTTTYPRNL